MVAISEINNQFKPLYEVKIGETFKLNNNYYMKVALYGKFDGYYNEDDLIYFINLKTSETEKLYEGDFLKRDAPVVELVNLWLSAYTPKGEKE